MPKSLRTRLLEKGWSEEEIAKTMDLLYSEEKKKKHAEFENNASPVIYWAGLIIAIVGNLLIAVTLIPFLMIFSSLQLYLIVGTVGIVFGLMFNLLIKDIERSDEKHHVLAGVFIPAIALITVYVMVNVANRFNDVINNPTPNNAIVVSVVYLIAFTAPYFIYKVRDIRHASTPVVGSW